MEDVVNTGAAKNLKKGTKGKKKTWTIREEEILISKWADNDCLFKTSSSDYKRHDKKAAAWEIIKSCNPSSGALSVVSTLFFANGLVKSIS